MPHHFLACDLGAESGRVILGRLDNGILSLEELHRFATGARRLRGTLRWDILHIFEELKAGLRTAAERARHDGFSIESLSVDSWGVDYALFSSEAALLAPPFHYRDSRTDATYRCALEKATPETIFAETGIQFMSINTLYQLMADVANSPRLLAAADQFLNIADYMNSLFCGVARAEESLASTTQLYNPVERQWSGTLLSRLELPERLFPQIVPSGTVLGEILPEMIEATTLPAGMKVIASCSHDTGCAVAAVPAEGDGGDKQNERDDWAYLSSGTWSLLGVELPAPLINEEVRAANYTNEAGINGTTRFLKNTAGLWLLQECRREWELAGEKISYETLASLAAEAPPLRSLVNPSAPAFQKPGEMPEKIRAWCRDTAQPEPRTPGEFTRCIYESLALLYRQNMESLRRLTGRPLRRLHIVGGGSQSSLLNQFAADATQCEVFAGPVEATAIGNVLIQALALGHIGSLAALRETVRRSFPVQTHTPTRETAETALWEAAYARFRQLP